MKNRKQHNFMLLRRHLLLRTARGISAVAVLTLAGCDPAEPGCDVCATMAIVYGTITRAAGEPVAGVPVVIDVHSQGCDGGYRGSSDRRPTNEQGRYRAEAVTLYSPFTADCFVIRVNDEGDPRWPAGSATINGDLYFWPRQGSAQRDSLQLDLTLPE